MQTVTVEYVVRGPLDGTTAAPAIVVQPNAGGDRPNVEDQIYRKEVEALGIIDPALIGGVNGSFGMRYLPFIWVDADVAGEAGAAIDIVAVREDGTVVQQQEIAALQGLSALFLRAGAVVPQGSALRIDGVPEGTGPTTVRITLMVPETVADVARIIEVINVIIEGDNFAFSARDWGVPTDGSDAAPAINAMLAAASTASTLTGRNQRVLLPSGQYTYATDIRIPRNVEIWGDGFSTILQQSSGAEIVGESAFLNASIQRLMIRGVEAAPVGRGLVLTTSQMVDVRDVQIWYFQTGIALSDGSLYSAHHQIGPGVTVNVCSTGILCGPNGNSNQITSVRVFWCFTPAEGGVALDVDSSSGLYVSSLTSDSADICLRVRNNGPTGLRFTMEGGFLEPGTNPDTAQAGTPTDIQVDNDFVVEPVVNITGVYPSANRARVILDPEGHHYVDVPTSYPFGARFAGSGGPKRNFLRNGMFNYFAPSLVPNMTGTVAPVPTFAEVTTPGDFFTGVRSIRFTPTGVGGSRGFAFQAGDDGSRWVTAGIRYRVPPGNEGFFMSVSLQGNTRQYRDQEETPAGEWREGWISMPLDPSNPNRSGSVNITPDAVNGTGTILVDEVWVTEGRYAVASTQYGERIEMLQAPIRISDQTLTGNGAFGPVNILNLPAVLAPPLDDFSAAPYGVVGGLYRFRVTTDSGAFGTALTGRHGLIPNIPAAGAIIPAVSQWVVSPQYSQVPVTQDFVIRQTSLSGVINVADGFSTRYEVLLVAWVLQ